MEPAKLLSQAALINGIDAVFPLINIIGGDAFGVVWNAQNTLTQANTASLSWVLTEGSSNLLLEVTPCSATYE